MTEVPAFKVEPEATVSSFELPNVKLLVTVLSIPPGSIVRLGVVAVAVSVTVCVF